MARKQGRSAEQAGWLFINLLEDERFQKHSASGRCVLIECAEYANKNGAFWPTQTTLARDAGVDRATVNRTLKIAARDKLVLKKKERRRKGFVVLYEYGFDSRLLSSRVRLDNTSRVASSHTEAKALAIKKRLERGKALNNSKVPLVLLPHALVLQTWESFLLETWPSEFLGKVPTCDVRRHVSSTRLKTPTVFRDDIEPLKEYKSPPNLRF